MDGRHAVLQLLLGVGLAPEAEVRAEGVELDADGRASFDLVVARGSTRVRLPVPGEHMVPNALAAAGVGIALGLDRLVAILAGEENIREVIAFPKTQKCQDLMAQSPTPVTAKQLKELHIAIVQPE